ncbi:MAG: tetratricopeptide repeat protein [Chloroflexota bacterium]|nr:tetratricopeptide repeat protein [Chloroflexota bacterium]
MPSKTELIQQLRQQTFTGRQAEIEQFRALLPLDRPSPVCVLMVYGIGGIGKSELLDQWAREAKAVNVWTARLDPRVQASSFDFLMAIYQQLKATVRFPQFEEALARHHAIETRLLNRPDVPRSALQMFAKGAHAALKGLPLVGEVAAAVVSPEQISASISQIYSIVGRQEGDFWMKPEDELGERLVADLNAYQFQHRILLMVDNYEWIGEFDDWVRTQLVEKLEGHVLLTLAGRRRLESQGWQELIRLGLIAQIHLQPFAAGEAQSYLNKKGFTDPQMAQDMADYADGHPLVLALLADLGQGSMGDLAHAPERHQIVGQLLTRITRSVSADLNTALEACAILRLVDEDKLAWMLGQPNAGAIFDAVWHFDFVKTRSGGIVLHEAVWDALNQDLQYRNPTRYCELQAKAATYYERALAQPNPKDRERMELERLYHRIRADEVEGIKLFQEQAEDLVRYRLVSALRALLSDVNDYSVEERNSRLWRDYYNARFANLQGSTLELEAVYKAISEDNHAEAKLRAYALCDLGAIWQRSLHLRQLGGVERVIRTVEESNNLLSKDDPKRAANFLSLSGVYIRLGEMDKSLEQLEEALTFYKEHEDVMGIASTFIAFAGLYSAMGNWKYMFKAKKSGLEILPEQAKTSAIYAELLGALGIGWAWAGLYKEAVQNLEESIPLRIKVVHHDLAGPLRDLGFTLAMQARYQEAHQRFEEARNNQQLTLGNEDGLTLWIEASALLREGNSQKAEEYLKRSLVVREQLRQSQPDEMIWLGILYEVKHDFYQSAEYYQKALESRWINRHYFECGALTGLARVKHAQADYAAIPALLAEAEGLAQQYEYNDHLASLRLTQGALAWEGHAADGVQGFDAALGYYRQALIYALRFNRFLLDEVLWGGGVATPLRPLIPTCLARGAEGRQMLTALRDWWQTGSNDTGTPRPDTISPLPEGSPLLEAERLAREREPGDGSAQHPVVAKIEEALRS